MTRQRLDEALVRRGLYPSRSRARDAILRGAVLSMDGVPLPRPSTLISEETELRIADAARAYVSRSALKLAFALDHFAIEVEGLSCLDLGASTGGFTQVLLARGAAHVRAIDVGHGQLVAEIANDLRVTSYEGLNARDLTAEQAGTPDIVVADLSFISLKLALPPALAYLRAGGLLATLIKPQFEAGREAVGKTGVVGDPALHRAICDDFAAWIAHRGYHLMGIVPAPIKGADGNQEFLLVARKAC